MTAPTSTPELRGELVEALRRSHGQLRTVDQIVDTLLPVVAAHVERQARERAADELELAADNPGPGTDLRMSMRARATALRGQA